MSKEQIEEMARAIMDTPPLTIMYAGIRHGRHYMTAQHIAEHLYAQDYRKQRYGEWELRESGYLYFCSCCGSGVLAREEEDWYFCPNCGAKMKGGEE